MVQELNKIKIHDEKSFGKCVKLENLQLIVLDYITDFIEPGVSTEKINDLCHNFQVKEEQLLLR